MNLMKSYDWPGNIRQLENLVRSHVIMGDEEALAAQLVSQPTTDNVLTTAVDLAHPIALKEITKRATLDLERQIILKVLHANAWNRKKTARFLQISYRSLLYKLKELGVPGLRATAGDVEGEEAADGPNVIAASSSYGD
jgi:two-component system response regulator AtoC